MALFNIEEELKKLPQKPGVYLMKDETSTIIYVGKAVILKNRVRQYFQSASNQTPKVKLMVSKIKEFEYIVTDSELEALILECNLIKKYKPKFNILLKDDKHYPFIKITMNEEYPRILITRNINKDGARYFGPYSNMGHVKQTVDLIKKLFPTKTCNKNLPRDIGKDRPCLNFHISQCLGPCQGNIDKEHYRDVMKDICNFLDGKQEEIIKQLEDKMNKASVSMEFELAANFRDKINSIRHILEKQKVLSNNMGDQDVIAFAKGQADTCMQVFFIRGGKLIGRENFIFEGVTDSEDKELMSSFIKQFYNKTQFIPNELILQCNIDEANIIESWLSSKRDSKVHIKVPVKGEKKQLVEMVTKNATLGLNQFRDRQDNQKATSQKALTELCNILELSNVPNRIEAYDISNTGSSEIVASMVVFINGSANKKDYRRFKIKSIETQNDYACMQEVIFRRFKKDAKDISFGVYPDLILVDGGIGHVNAVNSVLDELNNIEIPVYGMVKNNKHMTRGLTDKSGEIINLSENLIMLRFITMIQDEAHRFAVEYNRKLRSKRYSKSVLDDIEGIGPKKKMELIKYFGSIDKIKRATIDDLLCVKNISRNLAESIYNYFRK